MSAEKTEKWKSAAAGEKYKIDSKKIIVRDFEDPKSKIVGAAGKYFVRSKSSLKSGEIIEEVPVLITNSTRDEIQDSSLRYYGGEYPVLTDEFEAEGYPLMFPLGNYPLYRKGKKYNCVYNFNEFFNTLTIRAAVDIEVGVDLVLPEENSLENVEVPEMNKGKKGGCSACGRKEKPEKIRARKKREEEKKMKENTEFKSMVNNLNLKSIEIKND